jgi:hypothetical protein
VGFCFLIRGFTNRQSADSSISSQRKVTAATFQRMQSAWTPRVQRI